MYACAQVLEVVAEETAEELSYMELLEAHPAEGEEADQTQTSSQSKLGAAKQQVTLPCPALFCEPCPVLSALPCPALRCPALPCPASPCPASL